jgi:hypothetical protein
MFLMTENTGHFSQVVWKVSATLAQTNDSRPHTSGAISLHAPRALRSTQNSAKASRLRVNTIRRWVHIID